MDWKLWSIAESDTTCEVDKNNDRLELNRDRKIFKTKREQFLAKNARLSSQSWNEDSAKDEMVRLQAGRKRRKEKERHGCAIGEQMSWWKCILNVNSRNQRRVSLLMELTMSRLGSSLVQE